MSESVIAIIILVVSFLILMLMRLGIGFAMGVSTFITMLYLRINPSIVFQGMVSGTSSYSFLAVPFFIFAGDIMSAGGISDKLIDFSRALVGWTRGGGAFVNVVASMFFGGISGSAVGDIAALGPMEMKLMTQQGFDTEYSCALTLASSVQGMLIPPSHNLVIYAVAAGSVSIGALLMAGLVPGVFLGIALMVYSYIYAIRHEIKACEKFNLKNVLKTGITALWGLMTIIIILLGVNNGIMTATESAAVAAIWALFVSLVIYRKMKIRDYFKVASKSVKLLGLIMVLISASNSFGWIVSYLKIPSLITKGLLTITSSKIIILLMINLLLIFLGMIMSMSSIIVILTPILVPVLGSLGISLVQFGTVLVLNLGIGLLTPPVGGALYVGSAISGVEPKRLVKSLMPLYLVMFSVLMIITYVPEISLFLPRILGHVV